MRQLRRWGIFRVRLSLLLVLASAAVVQTACNQATSGSVGELDVRGALERYAAERADELAPGEEALSADIPAWSAPETPVPRMHEPFFLGTLAQDDEEVPTTQAAGELAAAGFQVPEGYWRQDFLHQMGYEAKHFGSYGFWKGFKTSFWDLENAAVLAATMGASIAIRGTGVDDSIREYTEGNRNLGDADEAIQILGNPATHFAAAGLLWASSTITKDVEQHELAKTLGKALAVNGATTLILKFAANTRAPDNEPYAWPSGHTSSAFTFAAVLNEYYGPLVGLPSLALAGLVGYQRIDSRVHDFSDVIFGGVLGFVVGTSIAREEKGRLPELWGMQIVPYHDPQTGASGLALMKSW